VPVQQARIRSRPSRVSSLNRFLHLSDSRGTGKMPVLRRQMRGTMRRFVARASPPVPVRRGNDNFATIACFTVKPFSAFKRLKGHGQDARATETDARNDAAFCSTGVPPVPVQLGNDNFATIACFTVKPFLRLSGSRGTGKMPVLRKQMRGTTRRFVARASRPCKKVFRVDVAQRLQRAILPLTTVRASRTVSNDIKSLKTTR